MKKLTLATGVAALALTIGGSALAQDKPPLTIAFTVHSSPTNTFWQAVKLGFDDGCEKVQATCQMIFTQTEGSIAEQQANMQAALAQKPFALITSIVDNSAFDDLIKSARDQGILVIATNVDDTDGAAGNARQAFIGQGFIPAGYALGQAQSKNFPAEGPINVLVGVSAPGQNWSEQRAAGVIKFMEEYKAANPNREVTIERIDSGTDLAIVTDRISAYLNANPETNVYFDTGFWHAGVARVLRERGVPAGKVLLGGFDVVPVVLDEMKTGYVQVQIDQQPYEQGFLPVMMAYLNHKVGLAPADVDTGQGVVTPDQVDAIMELSKQGIR
jgi:simple sugar transport system substrate-binding protein